MFAQPINIITEAM